MQNSKKQTPKNNTNDVVTRVAEKILGANNILVAVSKDPTVDELSAALGLTLMLDSMGKHATAIYSGQTPDALQFLNPDKTFEANTNSLQDFIIALSKEKADHLRYKVDGDYVKVFITPYRTVIDESDLEFSHGDFNVDLVIGLSVPSADDLDGALYEHGRILHDASAVNITNGAPGKFGEIEWSDPSVSSVSEMVTGLALAMAKDSASKLTISKPVATAYLTGIVASTDRFSNDRTTPKTMDVAAKLMQLGADQQLVSSNLASGTASVSGAASDGELEVATAATEVAGPVATDSPTGALEMRAPAGDPPVAPPATSVAEVAPVAPEMPVEPEASVVSEQSEQSVVETESIYPKVEDEIVEQERGQVVDEPEPEAPKDYGQLMEEALAEPLPNPAAEAAPVAPTGPEVNHIPEMEYVPHTATTPVTVPTMGNEFLTTSAPVTGSATFPTGPAATASPAGAPPVAPEVPVAPVSPEVPVMEPIAPTPEVQLPPPPMPPVDFAPVMEPVVPSTGPVATASPTGALEMRAPAGDPPVAPPVESAAGSLAPQPQPQPQPQTVSQLEQANDPSAFKIPGMPV